MLGVLGPALAHCDEPAFHPLQDRPNWRFEDPSAWAWEAEGNSTTLVLKRPSQYKPKVRRPFNLAWFEARKFGSFTMTGEMRLDALNKGNNDLCIAFGGTDESAFYYAHLGESADHVHLHLHVVNQADRKAITTNRQETIPWQPNHWHSFKLVRDAVDGKIAVWFDDQLILESVDKTFTEGKIGLGSFDDLGAFRNVNIRPGATSTQRQ
jgi:hypothetical protein